MRFGFVRFGLWRALLALVSVLGVVCSGAYSYRASSGQGLGLFGVLGVVFVCALLGISAMTALFFFTLGASFAEVKEGSVRVKMGWFLNFVFPLAQVHRVGRGRHGFREGVGMRYDFNGGLAVVSACRNIVELELREPIRVEMKLLPDFFGRSKNRASMVHSPAGVGVRQRSARFVLWADRVKLSLREPEHFMAEVEKCLEGTTGESITGGGYCAS